MNFSRARRRMNIPWKPLAYRRTRKIPFIPLESEIDQLIAGCGRKTATLLQLLKETAMRVGEAWRIDWTDIDTERRTLTLNNPEKKQPPKNLQTLKQTHCNAQLQTKRINETLRRHITTSHGKQLRSSKKKNRSQARKSKNQKNNLSHFQALESHHGIPQNKRHSTRSTAIRTQESSKHSYLHTTCKIRNQR